MECGKSANSDENGVYFFYSFPHDLYLLEHLESKAVTGKTYAKLIGSITEARPCSGRQHLVDYQKSLWSEWVPCDTKYVWGNQIRR